MATSNSELEITKTEEEWREILTPEQFKVLRKHGTEPAHTSPLDKQYDHGTYMCTACGQPLFTSETKYNSGTGWPSFSTQLKVPLVHPWTSHFLRLEQRCIAIAAVGI